ncbi:MAG TPA: TetR family transcriptional regulator [Bacteroidia bacterium]|nr:TetR family transcriptional regulator [Bacteroidia bacterium]
MKKEDLIDSGDKKELLLETAGALFAEHGFDGTSVRMIAEKSGMNIAMISYYFGSKEKLFEEFIALKINYMREHLQALVENDKIDPWEKMKIVIEGYSERIIKSSGAFHKLMMRELSLGQRNHITAMIEEKIMFNMRSVHSIVKEGIRKRVFHSDVDFSMLMSTMIGTITQTISSESMFRCFLDLENKKKTKKIDADEQSKRIQKHLKKLFASYLLIHPEKYKF